MAISEKAKENYEYKDLIKKRKEKGMNEKIL